MPVHRISFSGPAMFDDDRDRLRAVDVYWEGTAVSPDRPDRHRVLVDAHDASSAIESVRRAAQPPDAFHDFSSDVFAGYGKGFGRRPFRRPGEGPDWDEVRSKIPLTALQQELLEMVLNDFEPTWILLKESRQGSGRQALDAALRDLEAHEVLRRVRWAGGEGPLDGADGVDDWWGITDEGWDLLGLIKPAAYAGPGP